MAVLFAIAMTVPALAADIKIANSVKDQTYTAYKIFDVSQKGTGYSYTMASNNEWKTDVDNFIKENPNCGLALVPNTNGSYNVTIADTFNDTQATSLAVYLNNHKDGKTTVAGTVTGTGSVDAPIVITNLDPGYYFITSSLGSLCMLHTTSDTQTINEKNEKPDITKTADKTTAGVGETVTFTLQVKAGGDAATSYIVHDTMSAGLKLNEDFKITTEENGTPTDVDATNYQIKVRGRDGDTLADETCTFEITFPQTYTNHLAKGKVITITYSAVVLPSAVQTGVETNKAKLQYGNSYSEEREVEVYNNGFGLVKTDEENNVLNGAKFELYSDYNETTKAYSNQIGLVKVGEGADAYYRPAAEGETAVTEIEAGNVKIDGLARKTYYLKETAAPEGYNPLTDPITVDITAGDNFATVNAVTGTDPVQYTYVSGGIKVVNRTGQSIPETGGIGTTIFIVIGCVMFGGAGILLITKRRMNGAK